MAKETITVFNGADNQNTLVILEDGEIKVDLSAITRVVVKVSTVTFDSDSADANLNDITWNTSVTYDGVSTNVVKMRLGHGSVPAGTYRDACVKLYDAINDDGVVYTDELKVIVKPACS